MKKSILIILGLLFSASFAFSQADKIVGIWVPAKGTSQVRIFKATNGKFYGKVEWLETEKDKLDVNNPDPGQRNKKIWGLMILKDFSYNAEKNRWEGGTVYDPDNGKTYDCYMWFEGDDNKMTLKGYVLGMKFVGRAEDWTREANLRE
ncbi:MAG: DUF2147 domain-containing protein [Bacteroidales bacterium]|nr:DUF2147 domain-containing protein [Bacteroidales bacterium]